MGTIRKLSSSSPPLLLFLVFFFLFFFSFSSTVRKNFRMNLIVVIYVLASALMTLRADSSSSDVKSVDASQEIVNAADDPNLYQPADEEEQVDLEQDDFDEEKLIKLAKLFRREDSPRKQRDNRGWFWLT